MPEKQYDFDSFKAGFYYGVASMAADFKGFDGDERIEALLLIEEDKKMETVMLRAWEDLKQREHEAYGDFLSLE